MQNTKQVWAALPRVERKMRALAAGLAVFIIAVVLRYLYYALPSHFEFAFTDTIMLTGIIEQLEAITRVQRVLYYSVLQAAVILGMIAAFYGLQFCVHILRGQYIGVQTMKTLQRVGIWLTATFTYSVFVPVMIRPLLSWYNGGGIVGPTLWLNTRDRSMIAVGLMFVIIGWIMSKAIELAQENERFV